MIKKVIGPDKDTYVLTYMRTKTSLLGPFKKLNCLDNLIYITTKGLQNKFQTAFTFS